MEKLTVEDRIMGRTEPLPKTELQLKAFTRETKYKVRSIGRDNPSIMNGGMLAKILPLEQRERIMRGDIVIEYNELHIERIVEPVSEKTSATDEEISVVEPPKPKRKRAK